VATERWKDASRAWKRLGAWFDDKVAGAGSRDREPDALEALGDVGHVRRLLDEVELRAVRSARTRGRSWAEIATHLGVTRQAAWEKWKDLDESAPAAAVEIDRDIARMRRGKTVVVPNVTGLALDAARARLLDRGLRAVGTDDAPLGALSRAGAVVTDQSPESGASVPPGSPVMLWLDSGEGGVREPRTPLPDPLPMAKYLPDPAGDDVEVAG
jgi:hypothetical protein